jgi:DNA-binding response OmpR family regulator
MPANKILIIEDDTDVAEAVYEKLSTAGYRALVAHTGTAGLEVFAKEEPDLVVLDLRLPDMDGLDVCREIRSYNNGSGGAQFKTPVIMLTARAEENDRIIGLEIGADDYVPKPFSPKELECRIKAVLRRASPRPREPERSVWRAAGIELDEGRHRVTLRSKRAPEGEEVKLTAIEYQILTVLMQKAGQVVSKDDLLDMVWGYDGFSANLLQIHIGHIRAKIEENPRRPQRLLTVRSFGYKIVDEA